MSCSPVVTDESSSCATSALGRHGSSIPVGWDARDDAVYKKELSHLQHEIERHRPTYNELLEEIALLRVQLKKASVLTPKSFLGQVPSDVDDQLLFLTQVHRVSLGCKELDEDLRRYKVDIYNGWQEKLPSVSDQGQRGLPGNLRGLLQHIRNVWEHRFSFAGILGCTPQVQPSTTDVMAFLTGHFPDVVQDTWQAARQNAAGRQLLQLKWPDSQCQKRRRVDQSSHCHDLFTVLDPQSGPNSDDETVAQLVHDLDGVSSLVDNKRQASPLFYAAGRGFVETVTALIQARADPNFGDKLFGRTPLWEASSFGHISVIWVLLENRADATRGTTAGPTPGCTPLQIASRRGRTAAVELLDKMTHQPLIASQAHNLFTILDPQTGMNFDDSNIAQLVRVTRDIPALIDNKRQASPMFYAPEGTKWSVFSLPPKAS